MSDDDPCSISGKGRAGARSVREIKAKAVSARGGVDRLKRAPVIENLDAGVLAIEKAELAGTGDWKAIPARGAQGKAGPLARVRDGALEHVKVDLQRTGNIGGGKWQSVERGARSEGEQKVVAICPGWLLDEGRIAHLRIAAWTPGLLRCGPGLAVCEVEVEIASIRVIRGEEVVREQGHTGGALKAQGASVDGRSAGVSIRAREGQRAIRRLGERHGACADIVIPDAAGEIPRFQRDQTRACGIINDRARTR